MGDQSGVKGLGNKLIVALIPAYNEERFIGSVVLKARRYTSLVIVVDDGSSDDTAKIAEEAGAQVVCHSHNRGKGAALNTGFQIACQLGADVVVTFDGDGQHLPEELPRVILPICNGEADLVVGSRYIEATSQVPLRRVWGHRLFNFLVNGLSGVPLSDSQSGFRAFSRPALQSLSFSSAGFSVESEMQLLARSHGLIVKEVPITIRYQDKPKRPVIHHGLMVLNGFLRLVGQHRPLLFFGSTGLLAMLIGLVWGVVVVDLFIHRRELAVGYALISIFLVNVGIIGCFTGIILHSIRAILLDWQRQFLDKR
jgi:glycosyltransferase involved in cell wall biosynthesis